MVGIVSNRCVCNGLPWFVGHGLSVMVCGCGQWRGGILFGWCWMLVMIDSLFGTLFGSWMVGHGWLDMDWFVLHVHLVGCW